MKTTPEMISLDFEDSETLEVIFHPPSMGSIFLKALLISPFRTNTISRTRRLKRNTIFLNQYAPDQDAILQYKKVCGFSNVYEDPLPVSYLQTLFLNLIGKYITSPFFPINPLGLIQIFQSFAQKRPIHSREVLDLSCTLAQLSMSEKGIESHFSLKALSENQVVWEGMSTYFTRGKQQREKKSKKEKVLSIYETILVPPDTGRRYASVSGDYNPPHLYPLLARLFGFRKAIAHGMWCLARAMASLERAHGGQPPSRLEAFFKLPVFLPATITLGYERQTGITTAEEIILFELRDKVKMLPHVKGQMTF